MENVIYTNNPLNLTPEIIDFIKEDMLAGDWTEEELEDVSYDILIDFMYGEDYMDDLQCEVGDVRGRLVALADIGLWNGRVHGYRLYDSGDIGQAFEWQKDCMYMTWYYDDDGVLTSEGIHHDGSNYVKYYYVPDEILEGVGDGRVEEILCDGDLDKIKRMLIPITEEVAFRR